jgi:hypothetical protein
VLSHEEDKVHAYFVLLAGNDFSKTGVNDIAVAREDGGIEIYDMDDQGELQQVG